MAGIGALLVWILVYVALKGVKAINWGFLTDTPPGNPSDAGGGFYNGIIGSFEIVGIATLIALPLGIGCAVYLNQYATGRVAAVLRLVTDVMLGIPTIVTGAFVYALWVVEFGFSGFAGALALALVMVPLIVRATEEMLRLVPRDIREASLALGVTQSRTIVSVLLPTARRGHHHRRHARRRPRDGRDGAAAPDRARQRPLRRDQPRPAHVDALAADLRQRDRRLRQRAEPRLGGRAHADRASSSLLTILARLIARSLGGAPMTTPERPDVIDVPSERHAANGASADSSARRAPRRRRRAAWTSST